MRILISILLFFLPLFLFTQEPYHIAFDMERGAPTNTFYSVMPGDDGYLYLGSDMGMYRFDGMNFFHITNSELGTFDVARLQKDEKGNIWGMTFKNHLVRVSGDTLKTVLKWHHAKDYFMDYSVQDSNTIWLSSENDSLYKYTLDENMLQEYFISKVIPSLHPSNIIQNSLYVSYPDSGFQKIKYLKLNQNDSIHELINIDIPFKRNYGRVKLIEIDQIQYVYFPDTSAPNDIPNLYQIKNDSIINAPEWINLRERIGHVLVKDKKVFVSTIRGLIICSKNERKLWLEGMACSETRYETDKGLWVTTLGNGLIYFPNPNYTLQKKKEINFFNITQLISLNDDIY